MLAFFSMLSHTLAKVGVLAPVLLNTIVLPRFLTFSSMAVNKAKLIAALSHGDSLFCELT